MIMVMLNSVGCFKSSFSLFFIEPHPIPTAADMIDGPSVVQPVKMRLWTDEAIGYL